MRGAGMSGKKQTLEIDAVFLDVGGIILEIDWTLTLQDIGFSDANSQDQVLEKVRKFQKLYHYERGHVSRSEFFQEFSELLNLKNDLNLQNAFNKLIVGPLPNAEKIFDEFSGRVPIYALSNTNECHHSYQTSQFPILKRFDRFLTSFELGHRKPDPEIFLEASERMKVRPERAIFFDDSLANVEAAQRVGFKAFQTVNSPDETISILRKFWS